MKNKQNIKLREKINYLLRSGKNTKGEPFKNLDMMINGLICKLDEEK